MSIAETSSPAVSVGATNAPVPDPSDGELASAVSPCAALYSSSTESSAPESAAPSTPAEGDVSTVDANGNGTVTIDEAKSTGYSMPITSDHWLYQYMRDNDNDGMVGE